MRGVRALLGIRAVTCASFGASLLTPPFPPPPPLGDGGAVVRVLDTARTLHAHTLEFRMMDAAAAKGGRDSANLAALAATAIEDTTFPAALLLSCGDFPLMIDSSSERLSFPPSARKPLSSLSPIEERTRTGSISVPQRASTEPQSQTQPPLTATPAPAPAATPAPLFVVPNYIRDFTAGARASTSSSLPARASASALVVSVPSVLPGPSVTPPADDDMDQDLGGETVVLQPRRGDRFSGPPAASEGEARSRFGGPPERASLPALPAPALAEREVVQERASLPALLVSRAQRVLTVVPVQRSPPPPPQSQGDSSFDEEIEALPSRRTAIGIASTGGGGTWLLRMAPPPPRLLTTFLLLVLPLTVTAKKTVSALSHVARQPFRASSVILKLFA